MNNLNFGQAIEALKSGKKVCREGWNGKGMYLYLSSHYGVPTLINHGTFNKEYGQCIVMNTANNIHQLGWLASQTDMLAEDWCILE